MEQSNPKCECWQENKGTVIQHHQCKYHADKTSDLVKVLSVQEKVVEKDCYIPGCQHCIKGYLVPELTIFPPLPVSPVENKSLPRKGQSITHGLEIEMRKPNMYIPFMDDGEKKHLSSICDIWIDDENRTEAYRRLYNFVNQTLSSAIASERQRVREIIENMKDDLLIIDINRILDKLKD